MSINYINSSNYKIYVDTVTDRKENKNNKITTYTTKLNYFFDVSDNTTDDCIAEPDIPDCETEQLVEVLLSETYVFIKGRYNKTEELPDFPMFLCDKHKDRIPEIATLCRSRVSYRILSLVVMIVLLLI